MTDNLVSLVFDKGLVFAIAVIAVGLVGYFIKTERDDRKAEFAEYRKDMNIWRKEMYDAGSAIKTSSSSTIRELKLEFGQLRAKMDSLSDTLKAESVGIKQLSIQIHSRAEAIKKSFDESLGKILIIEQNYESLKSSMQTKLTAIAQLYKNQESQIEALKKFKS